MILVGKSQDATQKVTRKSNVVNLRVRMEWKRTVL